MLKILDFNKVEEIYDTNSTSLKSVRKIWDNYSGFIPDRFTIPARLSEYFQNYAPAKNYRPLGDFKDFENYENLTRADVYKKWKKTLEEVRFSEKANENVTMLFIIFKSFQKSMKLRGLTYSDDFLSEGLSMLLYGSAEGVVQEFKVVELLKEKYKKFKKVGFEIITAPAWMEGRDIDAIGKLDGKNVIIISVKNGYALSKKTIETKRLKGKADPQIYIGLSEDGNGLEFIYAPYYRNGQFIYDDKRRKREISEWRRK